MLPAGGRATICNYLSNIDPTEAVRGGYPQFLDAHTRRIVSALGGQVSAWGPARKALNLFMRDMTYNHWFRNGAGLASIEAQLEVPLDSKTMTAIASAAVGGDLRKFKVIDLNSERSDLFQVAASAIARARGIPRVHLDLIWWSEQVS
jgi:hypothetical protein